MSSIPLPALSVRPPQDPTQGLENAVRLSSLLQAAPIQRQILQQQAQAGQLGLQQQQQDLTDRQAMTAAWKQYDPNNDAPQSLIQNVLKAGGSGMAANQLSQQLMARQQQYMQLDKDAFDLQQKRTDRMLGRFTAAESVPDNQLADHVKSAIDDSVTSGDLKPQEAQLGYQLLQQGGNNPQALRQGLDNFKKSHQLESQILAQAKEAADTAKAQAETQKTQQEMQFYKGVGLAPGVTPDMAAYASYLEKGGKPEGFAAYKAQQEAAVTQPYKIQTAQVEAQTRMAMEGMAKPVYAYDPRTDNTKLMSQTEALQAGMKAIRPVTAKEVQDDTMLTNRLGHVHQKIAEYEKALQQPISAKDQGNLEIGRASCRERVCLYV